MSDLKELAKQALSDENFPALPGPDDDNRSPNFEYPPETDPKVFANIEPRQIRLGGQALSTIHFHWVIAPVIHIARDALNYAIKLAEDDGLSVEAVTGRVTSPGVLVLVDQTLSHLKGWQTYVDLGGEALNMGCIVDSPQSEGLHDELARHIVEGSPFISFSPDFANK